MDYKDFEQEYENLTSQYKKIIANNRLSHLYVVSCKTYDANVDFANWLSLQLLGATDDNYARLMANNFPDVIEVNSQRKNSIKVDDINNIKTEFSTSTLESSTKIFILHYANRLTTQAANSLLKFIEEPNGSKLILLLTDNESEILATIKSRAQSIRLEDKYNSQTLDEHVCRNIGHLAYAWFEMIIKQNLTAFSYVATDLIKNLDDKSKEEYFHNELKILFRDLILYGKTESLKKPQYSSFFKKVNEIYPKNKLINLMDILNEITDLQKANISEQIILETISLKAIKELKC